LEITLRIKGAEKVFVQEFVPLKFYRKALDIEKYATGTETDDVELMDKRLRLITEIFEKQFTKDELENGLNAINHNEVLYNIIGVGVLGYRPLNEQKDEMGKFLKELQGKVSQPTT
jgi:hypothetical protein